MTDFTKLMRHALALAERGRGFTSPNPMVGALVVKDGEVVGEGYHIAFGCEHAEVVALKKAGDKARDADLIVTLEPCNFYGKTPPCVDAIVAAGIKRVFVAMIDPNPKVNGKGIEKLREAGLEVQVGICEEQAKELNRGFISLMTKNRPWITLKLALTADGFIADVSGRSKYLTGEEARNFVKNERGKHDAILVGLGTVFKDDPSLLPLNLQGYIPKRIILDEQFNIPERMKLVTDEFRQNTIILVGKHQKEEKLKHFRGMKVRVEEVETDEFGWLNIRKAIEKIGELGITSVYCEGGSQVAGSLIAAKLVDELQLFYAPKIMGNGLRAFTGFMRSFDEAIELEWKEISKLGSDILVKGILK